MREIAVRPLATPGARGLPVWDDVGFAADA